ncbi:MAG: hypothetical protein IJX55_02255 [Clostridia bacterium]|nr:hypothetical protein [Clostridia bacterium]
MKTTFEFHGKGYLTLSAEGQSATLSAENPRAEFLLDGETEVEAVHSESKPKTKENLTPAKIVFGAIIGILLLPLAIVLLLLYFFIELYGGERIVPEHFFEENSPFLTKFNLVLKSTNEENVQIYVDNPVYNKKNFNYLALPKIKAEGAELCEEAEFSYPKSQVRADYRWNIYPILVFVTAISLALAVLGVFFMFHLPPIAENPVFFILGVIASLALTAFPVLAAFAIRRTEKILKETENNILIHTKGKIEK